MESLEPRSPEVQGSRCPANGPYYLPSTNLFPERRYHVGDKWVLNSAAFCLRRPHHTTADPRAFGYQAARLLLALIRLSVPRAPILSPCHPNPSTYLPMRSLYLGNTMCSSSANPNPFARFALAITADAGSRGAASSFHPAAPARPVDSSPSKKIRTALDGKSRDRQEPPKGLQEKYRYERALVLVLYVTILQTTWPNLYLSSFSATIVFEVRERKTLTINTLYLVHYYSSTTPLLRESAM